MELRRALLLFAIVLGVAAVVTSISRPERDVSGEPPRASAPSASPGPLTDRPVAIRFSAAEPKARPLQSGRPATVSVKVPSPGQVELDGLGLSAPADPLTPARFEVLERRPGRYAIRFTPAEGGEARAAGTLRIVRAPE